MFAGIYIVYWMFKNLFFRVSFDKFISSSQIYACFDTWEIIFYDKQNTFNIWVDICNVFLKFYSLVVETEIYIAMQLGPRKCFKNIECKYFKILDFHFMFRRIDQFYCSVFQTVLTKC